MDTLRYGLFAKAIELMCFRSALKILPRFLPEVDCRAHKNKKCTLFTDKVQDKKVRESAASWKSSYVLDWKFDYVKGVDEFYNTYYECGSCKLGEKEGCSAFVPCLCKMDERNYRNEGGQLHRTKTLANGDDCCDFHVTRIVK